jgi:hypothetical protein
MRTGYWTAGTPAARLCSTSPAASRHPHPAPRPGLEGVMNRSDGIPGNSKAAWALIRGGVAICAAPEGLFGVGVGACAALASNVMLDACGTLRRKTLIR